ncbi:taurine catabolism dioxygenase TauD TfdA [Cylindrobasidium torrendii FP15055 ss-10]|uniref:Taurine catabolism dioxygenase TauD TfdA n=1 Tax=Cylindrobasidium torrendii FP15055 ss-10 TaxID=1314674 RepID=A0A0D7BNK5_9AGAR|nr:taurine catabolism dioxygenase TauD TfdA [Cylindrobasidium torrendii FP15055 ss-10]
MVQAPSTSSSSVMPTSLSAYPYYDVTTHIGTCFGDAEKTQLSSLLKDENKVRDLATLVSQRGVVFFRNQDINVHELKQLGLDMGRLSWDTFAQRLPEGYSGEKTSRLHIHPISEDVPELGKDISVISSTEGIARAGDHMSKRASAGWHSDITFERVPSDYAILKMHTLPPVGGDTLWASAYEAYDRLSPAFQTFLEGLEAVHNADFFNRYAKVRGTPIQDPRGAPENYGEDLTAVHPVIRTNPVTGFKGLYVNRTFTKRILGLTPDESDSILDYLFRHITENHDLQVRFRWEINDVALWDNRSTFHTATNDYGVTALRQGNRVVSLGERPFLDPASKSRREALGIHD